MFCCRYVLFFCFFFFQAEDGIRDTSVTGVQTCALPILLGPSSQPRRQEDRLRGRAEQADLWRRSRAGRARAGGREGQRKEQSEPQARSEERRVGKECRSRWWRKH